jgi:glycosyltransferase A (GT-A) superfamily protein (DUF2064 family)
LIAFASIAPSILIRLIFISTDDYTFLKESLKNSVKKITNVPYRNHLSPCVHFLNRYLLRCQKSMLIIINAIPMGRKNIRLTTLNIMKMSPLNAKSIAAFLYDFEFPDDLSLIVKVFTPE